MIPVRLTMQAFGPYKGIEKIDFTKFFNDRLFLITGNTGSGKTMIFDAICYALFGEASGQDRRVDTFKSQFSDKSVVTYVEFEFFHKNKKYIITREPEQIKISRGKEIHHRQSAKIIFDDEVITGIKNVNQIIKDILGIDYSQFKQIVMIAQGEFRKLVSADSRERESIYRKIFNTMNFESIQNILKERASELDKKVGSLNEKINGLLDSIQSIKSISYEELSMGQIIKILDEEIYNYNSQASKLTENKEFYKKDIEKYNILFNKFKELINFEKQFREIDIPRLKQEANYLNNVKKTFLIRDKENILNNLEITYKGFIDEKNILNNSLIDYEKNLKNYEKDLENNETNNIKIQNLNNKIIELESLESIIDEKIKCENYILNEQDKIKFFNSRKEDILKNIYKLENQKNEILKFEFENKDINLKILDIKSKITHFDLLKNCLIKYDESLNLYNESFLNYENIIPSYNEIFELYNKKSEELRECEEIYLRNQAGILAKNLVDDSPCMVCGSRVHPKKAELFNDSIDEVFVKNLKLEFSELETKRNNINEQTILLKNQLSVRKSSLEERYNELLLIDTQREFITFSVFENKKELLSEIDLILNDLKFNLDESNNIYEKILKSKDYMVDIENDLKINQSENENIDKDISKIEANILATNVILNEKNDKLLKYNVHSKADYTNILNELKNEYEELFKRNEILKNNVKKCEDEILKLKAQIDIKNNDIKKLEDEINLKREAFLESIKNNDFLNVEEYLKFKLSEEEFNQRNSFLESKRDEYRFLEGNISNLRKELKDIEFKSLNDFENKLFELNQKLIEIENVEKNYSNKISLLESVRDNIFSINKKIVDFDKYKTNLNELNKISNGNNKYKISFERYILGIYFKEIIAAANIRFSKLTNGRYLFRHLKENFDLRIQQGLDISVFDNYTSNERKINTLSGGESFKASLSLALGLSDVVQRYSGGISIDTLFIDEGFGSLDSDSLQNALECLIDANDKSKLIGIISHVQDLKDFIKSKIEVLDSIDGSKIKIIN